KRLHGGVRGRAVGARREAHGARRRDDGDPGADDREESHPDGDVLTLPLGKYRMLDLSRQMPGPFCSALLGDMGMDVLVIVNPTDPLGAGLPLLMRNKRHMTLNLKAEDGKRILQQLVTDADVLLEGARPGVTKRLGIDYETLAE